jgi:hypothetical protein
VTLAGRAFAAPMGSLKTDPTGVWSSSSSIGGRSAAAEGGGGSGCDRSSSPRGSSAESAIGGSGVNGCGGGVRGGPGARPGGEAAVPSPYLAESDLKTSFVTAFSVSSTPTPFTAIAS